MTSENTPGPDPIRTLEESLLLRYYREVLETPLRRLAIAAGVVGFPLAAASLFGAMPAKCFGAADFASAVACPLWSVVQLATILAIVLAVWLLWSLAAYLR